MINRRPTFAPVLIAAAIVSLSAAASPLLAEDAGIKDVKAGGLTMHVPATWKQEEPLSTLRLTQFRIPAAAGDKQDAELAVFNFGGGGDILANVKRWIAQFEPEGRSVKIVGGKGAETSYVLVELAGTYKKSVGPPVLGKTEPVPGSRVLAAIVAVPEKGNFFLKLTGLDKTVAAEKHAFRASFGGDAQSEKELKLE